MSSKIVLSAALLMASSASALDVYLDFADLQGELETVFTTQGIPILTAPEHSVIQADIQSNLATIYSNYTVNFTTTPGGHTEVVVFTTGGSPGNDLGYASNGIDWRNVGGTVAAPDVAEVYPGSFGFVVDEFSTTPNRPEMISQLTTALSNTAAHELAHNLGIYHGDAYGFDALVTTPSTTGAGTADTGGLQKTSLMVTDTSGVVEADDDTALQKVNDIIGAKFEFSNGLVASPLPTQAETSGNNSLVAADAINLLNLSTVAGKAAVLAGQLNAGTMDYYSFTGSAGDRITLNVMADISAADLGPVAVDTVLELYDAMGTQVPLGMNNDHAIWGGNQWDTGATGAAMGTEGTDPCILNFLLPATGTYIVKVRGKTTTQAGPYELFTRVVEGSNVPTWVPNGWVYQNWPYVYTPDTSSWRYYSLSAGNTRWVAPAGSNSFFPLSDFDTTAPGSRYLRGWLYWSYPYVYSSERGQWFYYSVNNQQWVVNFQNNSWARLGQ